MRRYSRLTPASKWFQAKEKVLHSTRVVINISGEIYETHRTTLQRFPDTLLGNVIERNRYFCPGRREYFFQRNRRIFDAILFFYQSGGILRRPYGIPYDMFAEECRFFLLPEDVILSAKPKDFKCIVKKDDDEGADRILTLKEKVWNVLQDPKTSLLAKVYSSTSLFMVTISVISSCLQSLPGLETHNASFEQDPWSILELVLNVFFFSELFLSICTTPNLKKFMSSKMTFIDILSVVPYFVVLTVSREHLHSFNGLRIVRMARVVRMLRFSKHSRRIALMGRIFLSCMGDLKTLLICVFMIVIIAGSLMYYFEDTGENGAGFTTIPMGMYWAIQTLFTVGYGDIVPFTLVGKIFAGSFMMFGSSLLCLPLLSLIARFQATWDFDNVMPTNEEEEDY